MKRVATLLFVALLLCIVLPTYVGAASTDISPATDHEAILLIQQRLDNIENNHLAHIQDSLADMNTQLLEIKIWQAKVMVWVGIAAFSATILSQVVIKIIEKKVKM